MLTVSGCDTVEMKGTPFYSSESTKRQGPAEQRLNAWPLYYYRDPALSVLWPVFESTDDHMAVRPIYSVYGLDQTNREYNVLWPLAQFDRKDQQNHIFPVYWGKEHQGSENYFGVVPLYRHHGEPLGKEGGSDSLFPLWMLDRDTNKFDLFSPWPLVHQWSDKTKEREGSMVLPLYWHNRDPQGSLFVSLPWMQGTESNGGSWRALPPLFYQSSNTTHSTLVTPVWAQGHAGTNDWQAIIPLCYWDREAKSMFSPLWAQWSRGEKEHYLAPWALSWGTSESKQENLWLAGGLGHASWGEKPGPHHALPIYYRDAAKQTLLTPICGWNTNFFYPLTPLAGVRTGKNRGAWLFPLFSHSKNQKTGDSDNSFLVLGGFEKTSTFSHTWFHPFFSFENHGPLESIPPQGVNFGGYGKTFWCLPFCWYKDECFIRPTNSFSGHHPLINSQFAVKKDQPVATNKAPNIRDYQFKNGFFPLWSYSDQTIPSQGKKITKRSVLLVYDHKHEVTPIIKGETESTNDYTRARLFWRLYHYERLNENVSVDVFPTFTYDSKTDGYRKMSFLSRFFNYERKSDGSKELDLLFIPVLRTRS